ncbi:MAG TPA: hypothetical protein VN604_11255 [Nitrospirota bacterium]|nr:hypothetical protein [Nitrospirota bacterium]
MKDRIQRVLSILLPGIVALLAAGVPSPALGQMADYCSVPPFLSNTVEPNVLIVLDNSGSMNGQAYSTIFKPNQFESGHYYGYFDPTQMYRYSNQRWWPTTDAPATATAASPIISGDLLNWATMSRLEAAKKLLIGGKGNPRSPQAGQTVKLDGESGTDDYIKYFSSNSADAALFAIPPYTNVMYPFSGYYSFRRNGNSLTIAPASGGVDTTTPPASDLYGTASWT